MMKKTQENRFCLCNSHKGLINNSNESNSKDKSKSADL